MFTPSRKSSLTSDCNAVSQSAHLPSLPAVSQSLFKAKKEKRLTFEALGKALSRDEVAVAALFYGQARPSEADVSALASALSLSEETLKEQMYGLPDRGRSVPMPPKEPLIYRLYEIVQNYGYAYKAVLNEKFGDGIMSAISFSTNVKKETDDKVSGSEFLLFSLNHMRDRRDDGPHCR